MYGRGEAVKLDLGGSGSGGVTDSEITVYGFWVKSWCNLLSLTQAKRKRSEQRKTSRQRETTSKGRGEGSLALGGNRSLYVGTVKV